MQLLQGSQGPSTQSRGHSFELPSRDAAAAATTTTAQAAAAAEAQGAAAATTIAAQEVLIEFKHMQQSPSAGCQ